MEAREAEERCATATDVDGAVLQGRQRGARADEDSCKALERSTRHSADNSAGIAEPLTGSVVPLSQSASAPNGGRQHSGGVRGRAETPLRRC